MHVRLGIRNDPKPNSVVCEKRWKWCGAVDWIIQLVRISTTPCGVPGWRLGVRGSLRKSEKQLFLQDNLILFSLVIFASRFEATQGLFWYGPRNFEPPSDDADDTCAGTPLSKLLHQTNARNRTTGKK
ncbi:hypothetical protein AVEN_117902-1 [Araneus ventricosus]|uniref:Uncharacterized protein n=1 Tax=Araneus ventricosus TaxID=182803 RepID=A0A4Y2ML10_ARAVE|nr:hypothetical protein AVEN_234137-1 [Araneus ventricosus]GBN26326.1 hypothetical protein AVEN_117902-1 [Araneus ventricosus]